MKKGIKKYKLGEEPGVFAFWLTKTSKERLIALQVLRERYIKMFKNGIRSEFQRVYTVTKRK